MRWARLAQGGASGRSSRSRASPPTGMRTACLHTQDRKAYRRGSGGGGGSMRAEGGEGEGVAARGTTHTPGRAPPRRNTRGHGFRTLPHATQSRTRLRVLRHDTARAARQRGACLQGGSGRRTASGAGSVRQDAHTRLHARGYNLFCRTSARRPPTWNAPAVRAPSLTHLRTAPLCAGLRAWRVQRCRPPAPAWRGRRAPGEGPHPEGGTKYAAHTLLARGACS